jgi:hypothetical protein
LRGVSRRRRGSDPRNRAETAAIHRAWAVGTDPATRADIVFVQFPENGIRDATGVWLKLYVLNGIEYILSFAGPQTERVIINLSYGPTTGPHDGTAVLEMALSALVAQYNGTGNKPKLEIFLPAGNSYLSEGHVFYFRDEGKPGQIEWTWRLLPDNPVLCFSEARLYVGIAAQGRGPKLVFLRALTTMLAAARAALDAAAAGAGPSQNPADPYMTALCYFNALRELDGARRIVEDEV